jgi:hypothetical protein
MITLAFEIRIRHLCESRADRGRAVSGAMAITRAWAAIDTAVKANPAAEGDGLTISPAARA